MATLPSPFPMQELCQLSNTPDDVSGRANRQQGPENHPDIWDFGPKI
jgi:hypothetical protein